MTPLTVTASAREGGQTVTVAEALETGLQRRYKITKANAKPVIAYDTVVSTDDGWLAFPGNGQVSGSEGDAITVVDNTTNGAKSRKVGTATLPSPTPASGN